MIRSNKEIALLFKNNTPAQIPITGLLGRFSSPIHATREFRYDLSAERFSGFTAYVQVRANEDALYRVVSVPLLTRGLTGLLAALNKLNMGLWYSSVVNGVLYVHCRSDEYVWGSLDIPPAGAGILQEDGQVIMTEGGQGIAPEA